jgi:putative nucleotidyltransferase with HDIG domain
MVDIDKLQSHVQRVAAAARVLAADTPQADDALLAGLLHDIGYWILANECPNELVQAVAMAVALKIPLHDAEARVIGASHAQIGAYLLGIWGLPYPVIEAVAYHHAPQSVPQAEFGPLAVICVAHSLLPVDDTEAFDAPLSPDPTVDAQFLASVNAPFDWADAQRRVAASQTSNGGSA